MTKNELFEKYSINESHNTWEPIDNWMSVEIYRIMHNGALPPLHPEGVRWVTDFLDNRKDMTWWAQNVMTHKAWPSLYLTAKRMAYSLSGRIIEESTKKPPE